MRAPRIERDALSQHLVDDVSGRSGEQRDALAQGRRESDLAAHRPLGDRGDALADPGEIRKLVDAFLTDQRRIHVRDQKALSREGERLDDDVDRLLRDARLERGALGLQVPGENRDRPRRLRRASAGARSR